MIKEWDKVVIKWDIKDEDFLIFELTANRCFNLKIIRKDIGQKLTNTFHFPLLTLTNCMQLPYDHASHHFQNNDLDTPFLIRFGSGQECSLDPNNNQLNKEVDDKYLDVTPTVEVDGSNLHPNNNQANKEVDDKYLHVTPAVEVINISSNVEVINISSNESNSDDHYDNIITAADDVVNSVVVYQPADDVDTPQINAIADSPIHSAPVEDPDVRFPKTFCEKTEFFNGQEIILQFQDGNVLKTNLHAEVSGNDV
ncbi:hypothetical protein M8C21_001568, partial [Ambrosia artemisiifolia]